MTDTAGHGRGRAQVGRFPRLRRMRSSIDSWQQRRAGSAVPVAVLVRFRDQDGARWSVLLAHYGFLSLLPALLLLVTGLGYLLSGRPAFQQQVLDTAVAGVPVLGHQLRADVTSLTGSPAAIAAGVLGAVYGCGGVLRTARDALDAVAGHPPPAGSSRLRAEGAAAAVGLAALLTAVLVASAGAAAATLKAVPGVAGVLSLCVAAIAAFGLLLVTFRVLPSHRRPWRDCLPGALLGACAWTVLHALGGLYLGRVVAQAGLTYGALALVIGLLAWLFLLARLFLLAAALNVVLADRLWPRPVGPLADG